MDKLNNKQLKIYDWLISHPGYLKKNVDVASKAFSKQQPKSFTYKNVDFVKMFSRAKAGIKNTIKPIKKNPYDKGNTIIIGDTHVPFEKEGYLDFCLDIQKKYKAGSVIHIGDVVDNCYSSFHDNNPDGMGAGEELDFAISKLKQWYKAFPEVKVTLGNHCQIIQRKAFAAGLSKKWIKGLAEVLEVPNWQFEIDYEINNVLYTHGTGTSGDKAAYNKALHRRKSIVQGHLHSQASIMWNTSNIDKIFAMQVGCGVDESKYAFDYAKNFPKKFIISCGLVLENGTLPVLELMKL